MTDEQMEKMENEIKKACNPDAAPLKMAIPESARARALSMAMFYMMGNPKAKVVKFRHNKGQLYIYIKNKEA